MCIRSVAFVMCDLTAFMYGWSHLSRKAEAFSVGPCCFCCVVFVCVVFDDCILLLVSFGVIVYNILQCIGGHFVSAALYK